MNSNYVGGAMNSRYVHTLNIGVLALSFMYLNAVGVILPCTSHKRLYLVLSLY